MRHADEVVIHTSARFPASPGAVDGWVARRSGQGKQPVHWIGDIKGGGPNACGPVAPADGLYPSAVG